MAKTTGPLFSLSAVGTIAKTLTYSTWKGIKTVRQKSDPANPNSTDQQTQRAKMTAAVNFWRTLFGISTMKAGWDLAASVSARAESGFNAFVRQAIASITALAGGFMASEVACDDATAGSVTFTCQIDKVTDGTGVASRTPYMKCGIADDQLVTQVLLSDDTGGAYASSATCNPGGSAGDTIYFQLIDVDGSDTVELSGIHSITLT